MPQTQRLFIMEKVDTAKAVANALGKSTRKNGYFECGQDRVTWCFGHMLTLLDPEDYDPSYKKWRAEDLPLAFIPWKYKPIADKEEQLNKVIKLIHEADTLVHGGDMDDEGQLLIEEVIEHAQCKKPVQRIMLNDLSEKQVIKAIEKIEDNAKHYGIYQKALARSIADQLYGYNLTRAYTLAGQEAGLKGVLSVGRVQSAILGMVVRKDRLHDAHQAAGYYSISGKFKFDGVDIAARFKVKEDTPTDEKGRIADSAWAKSVTKNSLGQEAIITSAVTKEIETPPPLPFNLLGLQALCSKTLKMNPATTKKVTQSLREKHKLITYNRTNVEHLHEDKHAEAPVVLKAIAATSSIFFNIINKDVDTNIISQAFNSEIVGQGAHHGIIPTETTANFDNLSKNEKEVYNLIARAYVAQFLPAKLHQETTLTIQCQDHTFEAKNKRATLKGWEIIYTEKEKTPDDLNLESFKQGSKGKCSSSSADKKTTKAPELYTMGTLLVDLSRAAKYIKDEKLKKILLDKDKDIKSERGGIGTPATRDDMINKIISRAFIEENGKWVTSTEKGRIFHDILPPVATRPDLTAQWYERQCLIESGDLPLLEFLENELITFLAKQVHEVAEKGLNIRIKPSEKLVKFVLAIAKMKDEKLPEDVLESVKKCKRYINANTATANKLKEQFSKPTEGMLSFAKQIIEELGIEPPDELETSRALCSAFITENKDKLKPFPPTEKQLKLASKIAKTMDIELSEEIKESLTACSEFIDENISKLPKKKSTGGRKGRVKRKTSKIKPGGRLAKMRR
ncbi:MAG: DNA topoisomerase III [Flavobacteriaceae bacterium]|nr:MAG: DNA topoisomerase III [Flavobacteriaceae bacterium]